MKIIKKATATLLTVVLLLSLTTVTAFATTGPMTKDNELPVAVNISFNEFGASHALIYDGETVDNTALSGATYDLASNTLTIDNVKLPNCRLNLSYIGDDFKLKVKGTCELGCIILRDYGYGSSLCITGDGTLTVFGGVGEMSFGIYTFGTTVNQVQVDKSVTLHVNGSTHAIFAEDVSAENADTILMADGKPMPGVEKAEKTYYLPIYKDAIMDDSVNTSNYIFDYRLQRADDPNAYYAANLQEEDDEEFFFIRRYLYLEQYDAYVEDGSFGEYGVDKIEKDKLEESGYTFEIKPARTDIDFFEKDDLPRIGVDAYKLTSSNDAQGVYAAVPQYAGLHHDPALDTVVGYEVHRVIKNENDGLYDDDPTFTPVQYNTDELNAAGYSIVYQDEEQQSTLRVWHTNHFDSEDNWVNNLPIVKREGSDDIYAVGATVVSSWTTDGVYHEERGVYLYKVHHDDAQNADYINGESEEDGEDVISIMDDQFNAEGFYYVTEQMPLTLNYNSEDSFEDSGYRRYGYEAAKNGDSAKYAVSEFWYESDSGSSDDDPDGYDVYRLEWNEERGIYLGTMVSTYSAEEFKAAGYSYVLTEQPVAFEIKKEVITYELSLAEDNDGNQYLMRENYMYDMPADVYSFNESNVLTVEGKQYYIISEADKADIDPDTLTPVANQDGTGTYNCYTEGNGYHHIGEGSAVQTEYLVGDVNNDGTVNGADSGLLARYTAGWKGYDSKIKNMKAADINRDGKVNGADAGLLSRYTAGWKNYSKYIITVTE